MTPLHRTPRLLGVGLLVLFPLLLLFLMLGRVPSARADSYVVTTTADSGPGSLRQAMLDAASTTSAEDSITFNIPASDVNCITDNVCTIRLTSASLPQKTSSGGPLIIDGRGADITIDGLKQRKIITMGGGNLTLIQLKLVNGRAPGDTGYGGAIEKDGGTLTADSVTFKDNSSGFFGGAISSLGTTNLINSIFINNIAVYGGGAIYVSSGTTNVINSTFTQNKSDEGGAILVYDKVTITNSTFYDNGASYEGASISVNGDSIKMTNSLLVEGPNQQKGNCYFFDSTIDVDGTNISSDNSCENATQNTVAQIAIDDLGDYGGPTQTIALRAGSVAIDFAPSANCGGAGGTDQRGMPRNVDIPGVGDNANNLCDVGAFEVANDCSAVNYVVTNDVELDDAVRCINDKPSGDYTIEIATDFTLISTTTSLTYTLGKVTIDGQFNTLDHIGNGRHFTFGEDTQVSLADATLRDGHQDDGGGSIYNQGTLAISDVEFIANTGTGAIHNEHILDIADSKFDQNKAAAGGAINNSAVLTATNTLISNNNAANNGGAIVSRSVATTNINGGEFIENISGDNGGAFHITANATVTVTNSLLSSNESDINGGAFHNTGTLTVLNSALEGNTALSSGQGGGIFNGGTLRVENSTLSGNTGKDGGGIASTNGRLTVANSTFFQNTGKEGWGGGLFLDGNPSVTATVTNSTFTENSSEFGGAVTVDDGRLTVTNSTFYNNSGNGTGGAFSFYGTVNLFNNLLVDNTGVNCESLGGSGTRANNMADDGSCGGTTVRTSTEIALDPTLADHGGPTSTHALLEGSAAIDFIDGGCPDFDQRGVTRPQGDGCDVGAFELEQEPPDDTCPEVDGNVIDNFCFEEGDAPWLFHSNGHGVYDITSDDPHAGLAAARISITVPGSNVQFFQHGISLQGNTEYELTFAAKSSDGRDMNVFVHKHGPNYRNYGLDNRVVDLEEDWKEFTITFTTPNIGNVNDARLRFWFAPYDAAGAVYHIDRVVLRPLGSDDPPPTDPDPEVPPEGHCEGPVDGNAISNPGFEDQKTNWLFYSDGSAYFTTPVKPQATPYECDRHARVQVTTSGNNVQLFQTGIPLQPETDYQLRLAARATGATGAQLFLHRHSAPYTNYGLNGVTLNLTSEWTVTVLEFTTSGFSSPTDDVRLRLWLAPYDNAGARFEFDDVVLTPVDDDPIRATDGAAARGTTASGATTADAHLISGYFIDDSHTDRLGGGYVGALDGCRNARASVSRLWPANNKLWPVSIGNIGTPQSVQITSVWQDEPVGFEPDAVIGTNGALHLRAERDADAGADGRVYTIQFRATYADGQSCNGIVTVGVPLNNRRGVEARSGGELFTSTDK